VDDIVLAALGALVPGGVVPGELRIADRMLRWVEAGSGRPAVVLDAGLGEPGSLAWAGVLPAVAARTRVIAYDRAGLGASDPVTPLTADGEISDLTALLGDAGDGPCVLAGHSWGGLLAQLVAFSRPDLVAGLVLVDPAHEETIATVPWRVRIAEAASGHVALLLHSAGLAGRMTRSAYGAFARRVTEDPQAQALILDALVAYSAKRTQVQVIRDEHRLLAKALPAIARTRAASALPQVPGVVLSATKGLPQGPRDSWTKLQAGLAAAMGGAEHIVVADTGHAIHQQRPEVVASAIIRVVDEVRQQHGV
jgi:pimeloyl-ACP methyl ester carboxylesterase